MEKLVPRHLEVTAGGTRDLLTADVVINPINGVDAASLELSGAAADPGMTLRPLHWYDGRPAVNTYIPPRVVKPEQS